MDILYNHYFPLFFSRYLGLASSAYQTTLQSPSINFRSKCSKIAVFAPQQRQLCLRSKNVLDIISHGAAMGIDECKHQFYDRRWNCTTFNNTSVFGNVLKISKLDFISIYEHMYLPPGSSVNLTPPPLFACNTQKKCIGGLTPPPRPSP